MSNSKVSTRGFSPLSASYLYTLKFRMFLAPLIALWVRPVFILEFFGNVSSAVPGIVEIKDYLDSINNVLLAGLEHLDERYIKAVGYSTKAARSMRPKMILIADIASDNEDLVGIAASKVVQIANSKDGEGFIAVSSEARKRFWLDRARTAAIAKHTNAFKINDVLNNRIFFILKYPFFFTYAR